LDIIKHITKDNFKEESSLFTIQRSIFEKVNFKLNIGSLGANLETFSIEKKMFPNEKFHHEEKTHTLSSDKQNVSEKAILTETREKEGFLSPMVIKDGLTPEFKN